MRRTAQLTIADLRPSHIDDLRGLLTNPRHPIQPVRRQLFQRLKLIWFGGVDEDGRKRWCLTQLGMDTLIAQADVKAPKLPKSPLPLSGYYTGGPKLTHKVDNYDLPVFPPGSFTRGRR